MIKLKEVLIEEIGDIHELSVNELLKLYRVKNNITQSKIQEISKINITYLSNVENGVRLLTNEQAEKLRKGIVELSKKKVDDNK